MIRDNRMEFVAILILSTARWGVGAAKKKGMSHGFVQSLLLSGLLLGVAFGGMLAAESAQAAAAPPSMAQDDVDEQAANRIAAIRKRAPDVADNFSSDNGNWATFDNGQDAILYRNRQLSFVIDNADTLVRTEGIHNPSSFYVEVDAIQRSGSMENSMGIVFRYQDSDNFYLFSISGNFYSLVVEIDGKLDKIVDWNTSDAIETGPDSRNTLGLLVEENTYTLLINDYPIHTAIDDTLTAGSISMAASSFSKSRVEVAFDNFRLWILEEQSLIATALHATVKLFIPDNGTGNSIEGSGVVMSTQGLILTNYHVVKGSARNGLMNDDALALVAVNPDNLRGEAELTYFGSIVKVDPVLDLALVQIVGLIDDPKAPLPTNLGLSAIPWGNSDALQIGDEISIFGFPALGGNTATYTRGAVAGFLDADSDGIYEWIKTDAEINFGNSGGLATDALGRFVGVATAVNTDVSAGKIGFVRDGNLALNFVNSYSPNHSAQQPISPLLTPVPLPDVGTAAARIDDIIASEPTIHDDFRRDSGRWQGGELKEGAIYYERRALHIVVEEVNISMPTLRLDDANEVVNYTDFYVEVDATFRTDPPGGIGFHFRVTGDNYYVFLVSQEGYVRLDKRIQGRFTELSPWRKLPAIATGNSEVNRVGLLMEDTLIVGTVNGVVALIAEDSDIAEGGVAIVAAALDKAPVEAFFEHFQLWEVEGAFGEPAVIQPWIEPVTEIPFTQLPASKLVMRPTEEE